MSKAVARFVGLAGACTLFGAAVAEAAPRGRDSPETASGPSDKMVCKSFLRTGSLADRYRTCKTKAEWERERENLRQLNVSDTCRLRGDPSAGEHTHDC